ncbi:hypothetical protein MNBD_ALPHA11-1508 [hydrothermal vent metagenome]|uniref:N-acetyltransferase domain-containing protein n=1 Tax=hydrothermal vent metagenome TaxID=652676 RepID=A0A3B0TF14_9ZZZZ
MNIQIKTLGEKDLDILLSSGPDVFDNNIKPDMAKAYLARDDYFIVVALDKDKVIGMASGFTYFHPDKAVEFFVNEAGVHDDYLRQGIAKRLMAALFESAREIGCTYCWLATETDNVAANGLYRSLNGKEQQMNYFEFDLSKTEK